MEAERLNRDEKGKEGAGNDDGESGTTKRSFFALFGKKQTQYDGGVPFSNRFNFHGYSYGVGKFVYK
jgi:hypothetical protein